MNALTGLLPSTSATLEPGDCELVNVPGQQRWHTHVCPTCHSSWHHIAPTPMTQAMNRHIHTCTKCGTVVYAFVADIEESPGVPPALYFAGGLLGALLVGRFLDRR